VDAPGWEQPADALPPLFPVDGIIRGRPVSSVPSARELEIVWILWRRGSATVREVLDDMNAEEEMPLSSSSVQTWLRRLARKGWVHVHRGGVAYRYAATVCLDTLRAFAVRACVNSYFRGRPDSLVAFMRDLYPRMLVPPGQPQRSDRRQATMAPSSGAHAERDAGAMARAALAPADSPVDPAA
jgi:predicted transcriptional regulator